MKDKLDGNRTGLVVGFFMAGVHLVWSLTVLAGMAQKYMDWMFSLHMMTNPITVTTFGWGTALMLIVVTFVVGYILGWIFTWAHNSVHKK